ncbi:hypothetical protein [Ktedonobacter robiniae]|uniref:hypothetical protein n=1 Tax=Ktedonobacter robiniae TaxID=2778365 RepID=UPI001915B3C9|nr:hypothetical protein [Ktedonobacter robiniae]
MSNQRVRTAKAEEAASQVDVVRLRRQLRPFLFRMGPVALCITSVLLISLMSVLYLSQLGQAVETNNQLQEIRTTQSQLTRQNQDLLEQLAHERSPAYIDSEARKRGLQPADPGTIQVVTVRGLETVPAQP